MANDLLHKTTKQFLWEQESKEFYCDAIKMPDIKTKSENFLNNNLPQTEEGVKKMRLISSLIFLDMQLNLLYDSQNKNKLENIILVLAKNGLTRTAG